MTDEKRPSWAQQGILAPSVDEYLYSLLPPRDSTFQEMEEEAARRDIPIVGPLVGRLFYQLARMISAKTVFEMGSAIGYSTMWWALAVGEGGRVIYTDGDSRNAVQARKYFERAGVADRVQVLVGDALELLSEQKVQFDIVFTDIDKQDYPRALRLAAPKVRPGGLFVADNALWHGRLADADNQELSTKAIREFNRILYSSAELFPTLLPLRDGVAVAVKR